MSGRLLILGNNSIHLQDLFVFPILVVVHLGHENVNRSHSSLARGEADSKFFLSS